jgi:replicative DNA helicase
VSGGHAAANCEQTVLGAVLVNNARYWHCIEAGLQPEHFGHSLHQKIWSALAGLIGIGSEATPTTLAPYLAEDPELKALGGMTILGRLAVQSAGIGDVRVYARLVRECAARRSLVELADEILYQAGDWSYELSAILAYIDEVAQHCRPPETVGGIKPMAVGAAAARKSFERARDLGAVDGVPFGLKALDRLIGGAAKSDLVVIAGRPGMGKSALAQHIALHNARLGRHVVLFTLEMSHEQVAARAIAQQAGVSVERLRSGKSTAAEFEAMLQAEPVVGARPHFVDETPALEIGEMRARLKRYQAQGRLELIVVDYLQLLSILPRIQNRVQEVSAVTAALKALAKEFNVPVIALSQLSRALEHREDKRPRLSDLRESGSIEQDADAVIMVHRPDQHRPEPAPDDAAPNDAAHRRWLEQADGEIDKTELIVVKNRHGACDTVWVGFDGALTRFYDRQ